MIIIETALFVLGLLILLSIIYLYFLACCSLISMKTVVKQAVPSTKFTIVIPACNESKVIKGTLDSIKKLEYPDALYETVVIADNCTDDTVSVVRCNGVRCVERIDRAEKGKGYALDWAFDLFKKKSYFPECDAFVIIDADTIIDPYFLRAVNGRMVRGALAVQGYYDVYNPGTTPLAGLSYLGFALSRNLRYRGRTQLGWSNNLLGNGMCFHKSVIYKFGWPATSIVEDIEYAILLLLKGVRISFASEAKIYAQIPETFGEAKIQRSRWDIGKFQIRNRFLGKLLKKAIVKRDPCYLDMAMELLIPPFSLYVAIIAGLFTVFMIFCYQGLTGLAFLWFVNILLITLYVTTGLVISKAGWKIYRCLFYAPFFILWRLRVILWGCFNRIGKRWIKTER